MSLFRKNKKIQLKLEEEIARLREINNFHQEELNNLKANMSNQKQQSQGNQRNAPICSASWRLMNNSSPVPIAAPSDFIQLTPIVQPIPLVPYSTQTQPLLTFIEDDGEDEYI